MTLGRPLRPVLPLRVEGRGDPKAPLVQGVDALLLGLPERVVGPVLVGQDLARDVGHHEGTSARPLLPRPLLDLEVLLLRLPHLSCRCRVGVVHRVEDDVSTSECLSRVADGVVGLGGADQPGQHRGLGEGEVRCGGAEVVVGGGADPVDAVAEVDLVQVELEDLLLRVLLLHPDGERRLLQLSRVRLLRVGDERVLHELLGDRGPSLHDRPRPEVREERPQDRFAAQRPVLVEALVLDGEDGLLRDRRDVAQRDDVAILVQEDGGEHRLAVVRVDHGPLRRARELAEGRALLLQPLAQPLDAGLQPHHRRGEHGGDRRAREPDDQGHEHGEGQVEDGPWAIRRACRTRSRGGSGVAPGFGRGFH